MHHNSLKKTVLEKKKLNKIQKSPTGSAVSRRMLSADPHLLHGAAGVMTTPVKAVSAVGDNGAMTTNHTELFVTPSGRRTGKVTPPSGAGSGAGVAGLARSRKVTEAAHCECSVSSVGNTKFSCLMIELKGNRHKPDLKIRFWCVYIP